VRCASCCERSAKQQQHNALLQDMAQVPQDSVAVSMDISQARTQEDLQKRHERRSDANEEVVLKKV